jgi:hypothetical protein
VAELRRLPADLRSLIQQINNNKNSNNNDSNNDNRENISRNTDPNFSSSSSSSLLSSSRSLAAAGTLDTRENECEIDTTATAVMPEKAKDTPERSLPRVECMYASLESLETCGVKFSLKSVAGLHEHSHNQTNPNPH